jgi:hypothetical protein
MDLSVRRLGGTAQFECVTHALGWTPPGSGRSHRACSLVSELSPPMSDSAQSPDELPVETGCLADSNLADLEPDMSALPTNELPSMATDHQAKGSNGATASEDTLSGLTPTCCQLRLGNGTILSYTKEEVGDPPAISFANDIPCLVQTWDNTSDDWDSHRCVLHIQGQPIALVY